mmetsp:Transcript_3540/g.5200  ORF Transcript_3540/g.5200 Transcript_3540/m.5200 type:complete len:318 (-) Transcript_3540:56-1009(-)
MARCDDTLLSLDLRHQIFVVTGGTNGIGWETTKQLLKQGAIVLMGCRDLSIGRSRRSSLFPSSMASNLHCYSLDLSDLSSVVSFSNSVSHFVRSNLSTCTALLNNAGIMDPPHSVTSQHIESQFGVNHLSHFLLSYLLIRKGVLSGGRIVSVSSRAAMRARSFPSSHRSPCFSTPIHSLYCQSKLAQVFFTQDLHSFLCSSSSRLPMPSSHPLFGVMREHFPSSVVSLHPGVINSRILRHWNPLFRFFYSFLLAPLFLKSSWEGAQTSLHCLLSPSLVSGAYYSGCSVSSSVSSTSLDSSLQRSIISRSSSLISPFL